MQHGRTIETEKGRQRKVEGERERGADRRAKERKQETNKVLSSHSLFERNDVSQSDIAMGNDSFPQ